MNRRRRSDTTQRNRRVAPVRSHTDLDGYAVTGSANSASSVGCSHGPAAADSRP
ncbi:hypothetical protein I551_0706 [Mycobacterium ulcerans str. Harvey]|uniref:Uncharacterized protein n=1 Tax=Mycobacterium ulcerans str. Harvey TaxID=1299332 RepID=A0ABN0R694_MYCUL|nr:hypothetical protein I551_0706 [Mycobacterium ulcerans str. Harvey]